MFTRQGRLNGHELGIEFKSEVKVTLQKGRSIPIPLQEVFQNKIERLLEEGRIEQVGEVTY